MTFRAIPAAALRDAQQQRRTQMDAYKGTKPEVRSVENLTFTIFGGLIFWDGTKTGHKLHFVNKFTEVPHVSRLSSEPEKLAKQLAAATFIAAEILRTCIKWDMKHTPLELGCASNSATDALEQAEALANALCRDFVDFLITLDFDGSIATFTCAQVIDWVTEASADLTSADFALSVNAGAQRMAA